MTDTTSDSGMPRTEPTGVQRTVASETSSSPASNAAAAPGELGLAGVLTRSQGRAWLGSLEQLWAITMAAPLGDVREDLEKLRGWFDPVAQGSRLRRDLQILSAPPPTWNDPGPPLTLAVSDGKHLVTPEGRCAMQILGAALSQSSAGDLYISDDTLRDAERLLLHTYRVWSRHRLNTVVSLLEGASKPLQISAAGVVLALLVNRCTSAERALTRFAQGAGRDVIDEAFFAAVNAFATTLNTRTRGNPSNARLISGWALYEAGRRLGDALVLKDARGGKDGSVWIAAAATPDVLATVARDLTRGRRGRATIDALAAAFDSLVEALRSHLPSLAGYGLSHERPLETAALRQQLLVAYREAHRSTNSDATAE